MNMYVDTSTLNGLGYFVDDSQVTMIDMGIKVTPISKQEETKEYEMKGIHFIYEDTCLDISFYTIPSLNVIAYDDKGGYIGRGLDDQIYYIHQKCYKTSNEFSFFLQDNWYDLLVECDDYKIYENKKDALIQLGLDINKLHTTLLGIERIKKNLNLDFDNVVEWCKNAILQSQVIFKKGKNWYIKIDNITLTVNAHSYTIITAHKKEGK